MSFFRRNNVKDNENDHDGELHHAKKVRLQNLATDELFKPIDPEPPDVVPQRGAILPERAKLIKMQLDIADYLRTHVVAPNTPLDLPIERTAELDNLARKQIIQIIEKQNIADFPWRTSQDEFVDNVCDEIFGYGPIQPLIDRTDITEIMVNGPWIIYVEKRGRLRETGYKFLDDAHVERVIQRIVKPVGRQITPDHPLIDARLPDGSRVNAVVYPCTLDGPCLTIRKFAKNMLTMNDLLQLHSVNQDIADLLRAAVISRRNIIVSGGTGSGKTTFINILSAYIPEHERTVTIEDAAELQLQQRNVVRLETKKPTPDSPTEVTVRDCVVNALRMRPERIIVGECRNAEALDMLQAMNTGHEGSMTTIHANSPRDCLSRLETLVLMSGVDLPMTSIRKQITSAIHMIVHVARLRDGTRKVTHVSEIAGMEGDTILMQDIYRFYDQGDDEDGKVRGYLGPTGVRPRADEAFKQYGINLSPSLFIPHHR